MKRRTACLVLCVCLLLSLALPVGASDGAEFSDRGEIRNVGAVQMLVDLGLISGYSDGSFRPIPFADPLCSAAYMTLQPMPRALTAARLFPIWSGVFFGA